MDNKGHPDKKDVPFFGERLVIANIAGWTKNTKPCFRIMFTTTTLLWR